MTQFQLAAFMFTPPELQEYRNYVMMELEWFLDVLPIPSEGSALCEASINGEQIPRSLGNLSAIDGYQCWCKHGYEGNPYIPGGCQGVYKLLSHSLSMCIALIHRILKVIMRSLVLSKDIDECRY